MKRVILLAICVGFIAVVRAGDEAKGEEELEIREPAEEEEDHEELELSEDDFRKIEGLLGQLDDYLETTNKKMVVEEIKGFMGMGFMASVFEHVTKIVLPYVPNIGALFSGFEASLEENKSPEEIFNTLLDVVIKIINLIAPLLGRAPLTCDDKDEMGSSTSSF
ncbi:unnamed protein product, partial [Mesorhabditis spiculigera]